jgi:pumilio RNA-binding family
MATEDPVTILSASGMRGNIGISEGVRSSGGGGTGGGVGINSSSNHDAVAQELGMLLRSHSRLDTILNKRDAFIHRSGSAPPSVEGSLASMGGLLSNQFAGQASGGSGSIIDSERELRSDPAYLAYYYSHVNLNPRLPPPLVTRENYHLSQRLAAGGGLGDKRKLMSLDDSSSRSLFSSQPMLPTHNEEPEFSEDEKSPVGGTRKHGWNEPIAEGLTYGNRPKSLVDLIQVSLPTYRSILSFYLRVDRI